jgi:PAS domain S-box-containing protein
MIIYISGGEIGIIQLGAMDLGLIETLFDQHSGSPFFVKDAGLRYVASNRAMARLCGVRTSRDLVGRRAGDFFPAGLAEHYEALDREVLETGRTMSNVLEDTAGPDGERAWLLFVRVPVRDASGRAVGIAANARSLPNGKATEACYRRLKAATDRIRRSFDQRLSLRAIASEAGMSITQFERDFRKVFDMTPSAFLHSLRLDQARTLLDDPSQSVAAIAHACGYADHSAFSRRFLAETGMTPSKYRKRRRAG